jgi:hypothetical protein
VGRGFVQLEHATGAVNRDGVDHIRVEASAAEVSEALGRLRNRSRKNSLPEEIVDALARREPTVVAIERFGEGRHYASSTAFMEEWEEYEHHTLSLYQSRNSVTVAAANAYVRPFSFLLGCCLICAWDCVGKESESFVQKVCQLKEMSMRRV